MNRAPICLALLALVTASIAEDVSFNPKAAETKLKVGDTLTFRLTALPGAGYTWQPTKEGRDNLKFILSKSLPAKTGGVGGQQTMVLRFLATAPGEAEIKLEYGRQWEIAKGSKPDKTMVAKVVVE